MVNLSRITFFVVLPITFVPIVQGSVYKDLRKKSAETIASKGADGNAIGGLSVGEPHEIMYEMTDLVCSILPEDKPRYLMGVGTPVNILECISLGIDMFDCVMPTRNARHGVLYTQNGIINIKNEKWKNDFSELDETGFSFADNKYGNRKRRKLTPLLRIATISLLEAILEVKNMTAIKVNK